MTAPMQNGRANAEALTPPADQPGASPTSPSVQSSPVPTAAELDGVWPDPQDMGECLAQEAVSYRVRWNAFLAAGDA